MKVSKQFGELITEVKGEDSFGKAALKTGVSKAYLVDWAAGKVPRPEYLEMFLQGYKVSSEKAQELYKAADYPVPAHWLPNELSPKERFIIHAYRSASTPAERKKLEDIAREICEEEEEELRNGIDPEL